ncbi:MAG TPA: hypothetical protein VLR88_03635, partial [Propionibacteriaceae bacterium]|nr:hypothetical protein [Propionibacteriaceae bacterium]
KYGFEDAAQEAYVVKILGRFANPYLPDTVVRVGRAPGRKLSRNERFVSPASQLAERGMPSVALQSAMLAAMKFDVADDPEALQVGETLATQSAEQAATTLTGLDATHPLYSDIVAVVTAAQSSRGA